MGLQGSGGISLSQIRNEMVAAGNSSYSLRSLSSTAGKATPDSMSEFYGYSAGTIVDITLCSFISADGSGGVTVSANASTTVNPML
jgi:hypothetical protein